MKLEHTANQMSNLMMEGSYGSREPVKQGALF